MQTRSQSWLTLLFGVVFLGSLILGGCTPQQEQATNSTQQQVAQINDLAMADLPKLVGKATVVLTVNDSPIEIEVDGEDAPVTAGNFVDLVDRGFYDGLTFHRVVREPQPFVVQGGDPEGNGTGGFVDPETSKRRFIPLEIKPEGAEEPVYGSTLKQAGVNASPALPHTRGAVSMARSQMPNSASSQFFITLADVPFLDGDYAAFGYVTEGMDVVDQIQQGDRIQSAEVTAGLENLQR